MHAGFAHSAPLGHSGQEARSAPAREKVVSACAHRLAPWTAGVLIESGTFYFAGNRNFLLCSDNPIREPNEPNSGNPIREPNEPNSGTQFGKPIRDKTNS